jgi:hypothetical protein
LRGRPLRRAFDFRPRRAVDSLTGSCPLLFILRWDSKQLPDQRCRGWPPKAFGAKPRGSGVKRNSCSQWRGTNPIQVAQHYSEEWLKISAQGGTLTLGLGIDPPARAASFAGSLFSATGERPRIKSSTDSFSRCNCAVCEHTEDPTGRLSTLSTHARSDQSSSGEWRCYWQTKIRIILDESAKSFCTRCYH